MITSLRVSQHEPETNNIIMVQPLIQSVMARVHCKSFSLGNDSKNVHYICENFGGEFNDYNAKNQN